jgi:tRNA nucleotidyltransferase/poly(A) polymerase
MKFNQFILTEAEEQLARWKEYVDSTPMLKSAVKVLQKINSKGYHAYAVGGCVRDLILGDPLHDVDIASNCPVEELETMFGKTYDIGKSKTFGIVVVREGGHSFEVAHFREDGKYTDGRRPDTIKIVIDFMQDASRRDFTINAMGVDAHGNIVDYFDGRKDIKNKVIKTVGNPKDRFEEDYLRMLRVGRFSAKLGFDVDPDTKQAVKDLAGNVTKLAPERIKDEIWKAAAQSGDKFAKYLKFLDEVGILEIILPEITKLKGMEHQPQHHPEAPDVWGHILKALEASKVKDPLTNIAILLHDVGKGISASMGKNGYIIYYKHAEKGIELIDTIADRLKLSTAEKNTLIYAVGNHMKFFHIMKMKPSKVAKLVHDGDFDVLVAVAKADEFCRGSLSMSPGDFEQIVNTAIELKDKYGINGVQKTLKLVDGNHVMSITGLKPGKAVGDIIKKTTEWIIDNGIQSQEEIDEYIKGLASEKDI